ncbi:E3 ubiquitin-protein ligase TRIM21-like [Hyperolius riggenbachi]|uniref:E3 ubiquitin-protein ligase TRIM21-like n=1 Tax=Hyperolius riggenbachi TaxID=752182 RepID=UPI0035A27A50
MASAGLREELECSICLSIYTDPVTLRCGHNFCRGCIHRVLDTQEGSGGYSCPECREKFQERPALQRNIKLCNIVENFLSTQPGQEESQVFCSHCIHTPVPSIGLCLKCEVSLCENHMKVHSKSPEHVLCDPTASLEDRKCPVHKYYCTVDNTCTCVSCQTEESKERVQSLEELSRKAQEKADGETKRVTALFNDVRRRMDDLERRVMSDISRQAEQISLSYDSVIRRLRIKKEVLIRKMCHIEELCNMIDPLTVLQVSHSGDICDTEEGYYEEDIERCDKQLDYGDYLDVATIFQSVSEIITEAQKVFYTQDLEYISLDVSTAYNWLLISDDRKTASNSDTQQNRPKTPKRFQKDPQVLSSQSFSSGRHYWEVDVGGSDSWRLGMCYPSIDRIHESVIGDNDKSWCLYKSDDHYSVIHDSEHILLLNNDSDKVGIYLDYDAGRISFYDTSKPVKRLHTFTATFTEPLHAALCVWDGYVEIMGNSQQMEYTPAKVGGNVKIRPTIIENPQQNECIPPKVDGGTRMQDKDKRTRKMFEQLFRK